MGVQIAHPTDLPAGWQWRSFASCVSEAGVARKPSVPKSKCKTLGSFPVVDQGVTLIAGYTDDESTVHERNLPIILFGDHTRVFKFLDFPFAAGAEGTKLLRADEDVVDPKFLFYALLALDIPSRGYNRHFKQLREREIPIPHRLDEQRAIAGVLAKIQAAGEVQEKTVTTLKELKAATMARLFREGLRGEPLKQTEIGEIPQSWKLIDLGSRCTLINYGTSVRCSVDRKGRPVLRIPNVIQGGIDTTDLKWVELPDREASKVALELGDIVFVRTNGNKEYLGRCAVYEGNPANALFASYLIRVRLDRSPLLPAFVQAYMSSFGREQITSKAHAASDGKYNIDTGVLRSVLVPGPSLEEQQAIVKVLGALDARLKAAQQKLYEVKQLFSSMLHLLMTGRVRVTRKMIALQALEERRKRRPKWSGRVDEKVLKEVVRRIVEAVTPEKIILFGSAARGEMGPDSDLDLLVVKACDSPREVERLVYRRLIGIGVPKDILVVTPGHLEKHKDTIGYIYRPAVREGKVIYAS